MVSEKMKNPNPWEKANICSRVFFWWLKSILIKGCRGGLNQNDFYNCPQEFSSQRITYKLEREWEKELKKEKEEKKPSYIKAVVRAFGVPYFLNGLIILFQECFINVCQPVLLGYIVQHFAKIQLLSLRDLYLCCFGLCFLSIISIFTTCSFVLNTTMMGMQLRIASCSIVYKKVLKVSHAALGKTTVGHMVNLLSNDVMRFPELFTLIPYLVVGPLQTVIISILLWNYLNYAGLSGVVFLIFYIPFMAILGKIFGTLRAKTATFTDDRIRLMNDIISAIQVIKMYAWEYSFGEFVNSTRKKETEHIKGNAIVRSIYSSLFNVSSKVLMLISYVLYLLVIKEKLTPEKVFASLALFNNMKLAMAIIFPLALCDGARAIISFKRIEKFLLLEEQESISKVSYEEMEKQPEITLHKVVATWNKELRTTLDDITLNVKSRELLAIVGPVGCGKTSLLMSILGEIPINSGEVNVSGKIAYVSQEPWVFGASVKENIIFGSHFDEEKYKRVLRVCALEKDIEQLQYGDNTLVGERGIRLSGGQKARINLARAIYFDADIFLLDDPLSAVDASVAQCLFEECINGYLKDKLRILVTHQTHFLKKTSHILLLKEGKRVAIGIHQQLVNCGIEFGIFIENDRKAKQASDISSVAENSLISEKSGTISTKLPNDSLDCFDDDNSFKKYPEKLTEAPKEEEEKSYGTVNFKVYKEYIMASKSVMLISVVIILLFAAEIPCCGSDYWLSIWTNEEQLKYNIEKCWLKLEETLIYKTSLSNRLTDILQNITLNENPVVFQEYQEDCSRWTKNYTLRADDLATNYHLYVYSGLVLAIFPLCFIRILSFFFLCLKSSINLHNKMFHCILRAPIAFFGKNPLGRILNRFAKDMGTIDETIPVAAFSAASQYASLIGIIILVSVIEVWLLISSIVIIIFFFLMWSFYLPTARDVKRYEGIYKSPVFSHLSTTLNGLISIRAYRVQNAFIEKFHHFQDSHTAVCFILYCTMQWFRGAIRSLSVSFVSSVVLAMALMSNDDSHASKAGLAITSALHLCTYFEFGIRQTVELQCMMTSVERLLEYGSLKSEAELKSEPDKSPPDEWPTQGEISFNNVILKYLPDVPPVLKNLNFTIYPREKIGIVGRTGAGKSSIISALFRMTEPDGVLRIDGVDIKNIGLHDLRSKMSIIPQDPGLISGTLRMNLDPLKQHTDSELWQALEMADMKKVIECLPEGLDVEISAGGSNLSVGQKQLLCLARAILSKNRILVLDEATANVDSRTDAIIQKAIREHFKSCTVLTIAHRLNTIMDSDRIMVLDNGEIIEFDHPVELLKNPKSLFSRMIQITVSSDGSSTEKWS